MLESLVAAARTGAADDDWYEGLLDWLARVGQILAAVLAVGAVLAFIWTTYRRTLGRRRQWYERLARLGTNAHVLFFASVLGEPPAMRRTVESSVTRYDDTGNRRTEEEEWIECVWIDRDFYVHAIADEDETVQSYSVTTRSKRFRPTFRPPGGSAIERGRLGRLPRRPRYKFKLNPKVRLAKTRFSMLGKPQFAASWMGAHNMHYFEAFWGGNPGFYQSFFYSVNDAGYGVWDLDWDSTNMRDFSWGVPHGPSPDDPLPPFYAAFRRRATVNTYTVLGPELSLDDYPFFSPPPDNYPTIFGVNSTRTRTLAGE